MSRTSLWARARTSRLLLVIAIATVVGVALWLVYIFPTIWESLMRLPAAESDELWWAAWRRYTLQLFTMWFAPIGLGALAVVFLVLRAVLKADR